VEVTFKLSQRDPSTSLGMTEAPFQNRDGIFPQANPCAPSPCGIENGKSLIISNLSLSLAGWHGHCVSGARHDLFFESKDDAKRISRERKKK